MTPQKDRAVALLKVHGPMRGIELSNAGIHPETLARMLRDRILIRVTRGLYQFADAEVTAPHDLAEVAKLVPKGVICLVCALQFHELTLQMPGRVWLAIGSRARKPGFGYPLTRVVRFGPRALSLGVRLTATGHGVRAGAPGLCDLQLVQLNHARPFVSPCCTDTSTREFGAGMALKLTRSAPGGAS